jgi:hypothetical protein
MSINSIINFGRFKGQSIINTWRGSYELDPDSIIRAYLMERFEKKDNHKRPCSDADLSDCTTEINFLNEQNISYELKVIKNYIIITSRTSHDNIIKIKKVLKAILNGSYVDMTKQVTYPGGANVNELVFSENSSKFIALSGNPKYLKWCIENINSFFIFPDDLEKLKTTEVKVFETFELIELEYDVIKYQPVYQTYVSQISLKTEQMNLQKYNAYTKMNANRNNDSYYSESGSSTNWAHYNDDLDIDQQSPEFWDQF